MNPSREIYNRILWDRRLDAGAFAIGYQDRMAPDGLREMPLLAWDPNGDVPWHRIRYFRCLDTIVWDRDLRVDLFAAEALPEAAWAAGARPETGRRMEQPSLTTELRAALLGAEPTHRSAIVVIPPEALWPPIQAIRRLHDRTIERWMPHITMVYGFLPDELFGSAARLLASALAATPPFEVRLTGFDLFEHRASCTAWLRPEAEPPDALARLQGIMQALFPQCDEQSSRPSGFVPHLSVGQFRSPADADARLPEWATAAFSVEEVALISRRDDGPFEVREQVPLGGSSTAG